MKKVATKVSLLLVIPLMLSSVLAVNVSTEENSWNSLRGMPTARSGLQVAAVDGKIYAIGGSTASGFFPSVPSYTILGNRDIDKIVGTNEEYDPETNNWTTKQSMPTPRMLFAIAVYQNKIYCIGGKTDENYTAVNEVYDPQTNTWQTKTPMSTARGWITANVVNNKIYVISGSSNDMYDPETDNWTTKTNPPTNGTFPSCVSAVFDEKIYVIGGISEDQHFVLNRIYDTKTDSWSYGSPPPSSVGGGAALTTTGVFAPQRIYVIGYTINLKQGEENRFTRIYDPETDNWTYGEDIPTKRWNFGATVLNDTIYIIGGHDHQWIPGNFKPLTTNEQYNPAGYIPEFPAWLTMPLILATPLFVAIVRRKVFRPT